MRSVKYFAPVDYEAVEDLSSGRTIVDMQTVATNPEKVEDLGICGA